MRWWSSSTGYPSRPTYDLVRSGNSPRHATVVYCRNQDAHDWRDTARRPTGIDPYGSRSFHLGGANEAPLEPPIAPERRVGVRLVEEPVAPNAPPQCSSCGWRAGSPTASSLRHVRRRPGHERPSSSSLPQANSRSGARPTASWANLHVRSSKCLADREALTPNRWPMAASESPSR